MSDDPHYLHVQPLKGPGWRIDLDERGWIAANPAAFDTPCTWTLVEKGTGRPVLTMAFAEGEAPSYWRRHIGPLSDPHAEILCHGLQREMPDGTKRSIWRLPDGSVCMDDDVYTLAPMHYRM